MGGEFTQRSVCPLHNMFEATIYNQRTFFRNTPTSSEKNKLKGNNIGGEVTQKFVCPLRNMLAALFYRLEAIFSS